jgi:hypothetical protein
VAVIVGQGAYRYSVDKHAGRGPKSLAAFGVVSGVAADSRDRVYIFNRSSDPFHCPTIAVQRCRDIHIPLSRVIP